ncbi:MAG: MAPEG family protein [bacterium]|nr:MAPEG family protein [bacterium]
MLSAAFDAYRTTIVCLGLAGGLLVLQLLVVDVAGLRRRHPPGLPIEPDPTDFLFRATRAHANTNESIAAFTLLAIFSVAVGADAAWTNGLATTWVLGRVAHMACYYAGWGPARSASFGLSLIALLGLFVNGMRGLL